MSFPPGTEMFQFPGFASNLCIQYLQIGPGFPIRKSTDQCLLGTSPWLIAACHVLHRLYAPRHPPDALKALNSHARIERPEPNK